MKSLLADLGLTARCGVLLVLALAALIVSAVMEIGALYGVAVAAAFAAGACWNRRIHCDDCGTCLEELQGSAPGTGHRTLG